MKMKRFAAAAAVLAMAASMASIPANAEPEPETTPVPVYSTTVGGDMYAPVEKYLVMKNDATVPNASFSFTVAAGQAVAADTEQNTVEVRAGIGTPVFLLSTETDENKVNDNTGSATNATVIFSKSDATTPENGADHDKINFSTPADLTDEKYVQKKLVIDFTGIAFPEPGVYRYVITESAAGADQPKGVTNDTNNTRILDVVVEDDSSNTDNKLKISNYLLHNNATDTPVKGTGELSGTATIANKSTGFTNKYETYNLEFSKSVEGNQGSRDKYFLFTVSITNAKGAEITVVGKDNTFSSAPAKSASTIYEASAMAAANTRDEDTADGQQLIADEDGRITASFYLRHGQSVILQGLPAGAKYSIVEDAESYTLSVNVNEHTETPYTGDVTANAAGNGITDQDTGIQGNTNAAFTNTQNGTIPTGLISTVAASAGIAALGAAGVAGGIIIAKKKKHEDE
ncbi:MAG: hypothetical protein IJ746_07725 [Ruminococcus sp.]|nr:hypothetical protein [Ruminococcus sp.]